MPDDNNWRRQSVTQCSGFNLGDKARLSITSHTEVPVQVIPKQLQNLQSFRGIPFYKLFKFTTKWEMFMLFLGLSSTLIMALCQVFSMIFYKEYADLLFENSARQSHFLQYFGGRPMVNESDPTEFQEMTMINVEAFLKTFVILTFIAFVLQAVSVNIFNSTALKQINRIRYQFLKSILKQDMVWYDTNSDLNFVSYITEDMDKIRDGIAERVVLFFYVVVNLIINIIVSFIIGWKLSLIIMICVPFVAYTTFMSTKVQESLSAKESEAYSKAGSVAEEVISAIRTVVAFSGEKKEVERYSNKLGLALTAANKKGILSGIWSGSLWIALYSGYSMSLWVGAIFVINSRRDGDFEYTTGSVTMIMFGLVTGAQVLGYSLPYLDSFAKAKSSAGLVYRVIERTPIINSISDNGRKLAQLKGEVSLDDVNFSYPARPNVKVLKNLSLEIKQGEKVVLVGPSGCGKSTIIQLIQRLYDPHTGVVSIGGEDVKSLNVNWLRGHISVVGQEPVLFATTIANNILNGNPTATQKDVEAAARIANCHDFIMKLPNGYLTLIGEKGAQLSGGQKQRIAIARAVIKKPAILLLDEATSALDRYNEKIVQEALDRISQNVTTISVTHRLNSISKTDKIMFISDGQVVESGTHEELIERQGKYYKLASCMTKDNSGAKSSGSTEHLNKETPLEQDKVDEEERPVDESSPFIQLKSTSKVEIHDDEGTGTFLRILKLNKPEWPHMIIGCVLSIGLGAMMPLFAAVMGCVYGELQRMNMTNIKYLSAGIFTIGVITAVGIFLQSYLFTKSGSQLTMRLRKLCFEAILQQEMAWFDKDENNVGSLTTRLSSDAGSVQNATGTVVGILLQSVSVICFGIIVCAVYSWKVALLSVPIVPLVFFIVWFENYVNEKSCAEEKSSLESSSRIAVEAISNIKTVQSLCLEKDILRKYKDELDKCNKSLIKKIKYRGVIYSLNKYAPYFAYGACMWYAGYLISIKEIEKEDLIKCCEGLMFGIWMIGMSFTFTPDFNAAKLSAKRIFKLVDKQPAIVSSAHTNLPQNWKCDGHVNFDKVQFSYPLRPGIKVLDDFSLKITTGKTIALVGQSGCGKSTCIQLLQRLYEPHSGRINLDDKDIQNDVKLGTLRNQLGLVSQEPVLFNRTIAENIAYGDNNRTVEMEDIISAAKKANIHTFVTSLPLGYNTDLGAKGANLSGGQKQRIAIARALVRNPRILLLDEATSALDNESEKVVQEALDKACENRTSIIIAHRLRTIQNADLICVLEEGQIKEMGTHEQLMSRDSIYRKLYSLNQ